MFLIREKKKIYNQISNLFIITTYNDKYSHLIFPKLTSNIGIMLCSSCNSTKKTINKIYLYYFLLPLSYFICHTKTKTTIHEDVSPIIFSYYTSLEIDMKYFLILNI